ncbi:hypothetical protein AB0D14_15065 [Streptomyces sp. NPDC048484]|uniref:hypothetical protein n=1 Tax=Streptomyces sp. NPDC048484 TaxID=3155146 RepID=UPI00341AC307
MADFIRGGRLFRVVGFNPSHRQLFLTSESLAVNRTTSQVEVYIGHVRLMLLKPYYREGVHIRRASPDEFAVLRDRHKLEPGDAEYTWMLEPDGGDSFVIGGKPSWREAEYELMGDREALYDTSKPWPPDFPVESGQAD